MTGTIVTIDEKNNKVTLKFADGSTKTCQARKDADVSKQKRSDKIVFRVTEMAAIDIVKM